MGKAWFIDCLGWSGIFAWIGISIYSAVQGASDQFQASGSIGIAVAVGYFVMQRHANPIPTSVSQSIGILTRHNALNSDAIAKAFAQIALLAKALEFEAKKRGDSVSSTISELAKVPFDHVSEQIQRDPHAYDHEIEANTNDLIASSQRVASGLRKSEGLQAGVVILGTIQSGFGSHILKFGSHILKAVQIGAN